MVRIRSPNEIILNSIDFYRTAQPNLSTNPGSNSKDVLIDNPAIQLGRFYEELKNVSTLSSILQSTGSNLDNLLRNFGITRGKGSKSTGSALLTFASLDADLAVNKGDLIFAKNGSTFVVQNSLTISPVLINSYRATATKFRSDLDFLGITDEFAVEILTEASASGTQGNISKYTLNRTNISGINHVTNVFPFGGGKNSDDDASLKRQFLSVLAGANTGTALGYRNAVLTDDSVIDAVVIEPGDSLMTRDGTVVDEDDNIISEGTGGKTDVLIFGNRFQEVIDSFIYHDLSNTGDTTNSANDFVLGQIAADANKTVTRKRIDNLKSRVLPNQPVNNIVKVSGTLSGPNFVEKTVDELGRVSGNYELIRDTGAFAGSPWGFDRLHWISDRISFFEDKTKSSFNSQDPLSFTDVLEITAVQQSISISNENSKVLSSDRSIIQLAHFPITSVTKVFNLTTGERYVVSNQNPDGSGSTNFTGRIKISGKSLPAVSDLLQVDYTWILDYNPYFDFDNRINNYNIREAVDSLDWGLSNSVKNEISLLQSSGSILTVNVSHTISSVVSIEVFANEEAVVTLVDNRLAAIVSQDIINVNRISNENIEVWNTLENDGTFSAKTIFLPTDTPAEVGDTLIIIYNTIDVYNTDNQGSFNDNIITIIPSVVATAGTLVQCNYISNINTILPSIQLSDLPAIRFNNTFNTNSLNNIGSQPTSYIFDSSGEIINNLRRGPSNLSLTITGNFSPGTITISGSTISYVEDVVFTCLSDGLKQNLSGAIRSFLGLNSQTSLPNNIKIITLEKFERVEVSSNLEVLDVLQTYDIQGYSLNDNFLRKNEAGKDSSLSAVEILLPSTSNNLERTPLFGERFRARFHIMTSNDTENINFTKAGTLYSNKKFIFVDTIAKSGGFTSISSTSAVLTVNNLNQPNIRSRYKVFYDYLGPKPNERITISYNYQKIITDATFAIENTRPTNADVLVKSTTALLVDVIINIVITDEFLNSTALVVQNSQDVVTSALNATALATTIDSYDLLKAIGTVSGVDRARILYFNKSGENGTVLSITAKKNQFVAANNVTINVETR